MTVLVNNKKAYLNYEIIDTYKAGISLLGFEVKSLKNSRGSLDGAYVIIRGNEAFLINADIPPYQAKNTDSFYDSFRTRKLLLKKKEIKELEKQAETKGLTLIPLSMYNYDNRVKVEIGVARGKKKHDKRETLKKRDTEREMRRELKVR